MEQQVPTLVYTKNVLLFKDKDVTRSNGEVFIPNLMELSQLRKTDQFKRGIPFHKDMSHIDVGDTLERLFPALRKKR